MPTAYAVKNATNKCIVLSASAPIGGGGGSSIPMVPSNTDLTPVTLNQDVTLESPTVEHAFFLVQFLLIEIIKHVKTLVCGSW